MMARNRNEFFKSSQQAQKEREQGFVLGGSMAAFNATNPTRATRFVMIPKLLEFATEHAGLVSTTGDLKFHKHIALQQQDKDLLELGYSTIETLRNQDSALLCPRVLFLGKSRPDDFGLPNNEVNKFNRKHYQGHLLHDYVTMLHKERQIKEIEIHIAAHGGPEGIGTMLLDNRLTPEVCGELLVGILEDIPKKFKINIVFDCCNSAYCDFSDTAKENEATMKQEVIENTFIGKVAQCLIGNNIRGTVSGFRGYYIPLATHTGVLVSSSRQLNMGVEYRAEKAKFTLDFDNEHVYEVRLPEERYRTFNVDMLPPLNLEPDAPGGL